MSELDKQYHALLEKLLTQKTQKDRTGTGTRRIFDYTLQVDLSGSQAALLTTKQVLWKSAAKEMLWFVHGHRNVNQLNAKIWDAWASDNGELGPIYGAMWRAFPASDTPKIFRKCENNITEGFTYNGAENDLYADLARIRSDFWNTSLNKLREAYTNTGEKLLAVLTSDELYKAALVPGFYNFLRNPEQYVLYLNFYDPDMYDNTANWVWVTREQAKKYNKNRGVIVEHEDAFGNIVYTPFVTKKEAKRAFGNVFKRFASKIRIFDCPENTVVRYAPPTDQLMRIISDLKTQKHSRRIYMTGWHPGVVPYNNNFMPFEHAEKGNQALPPCHLAIQCFVDSDDRLNMKLFMRSSDVFLGLPFNLFQYGLLLRMIAMVTDLRPGKLIYNGGDVHLYENHVEQAKQQLKNDPTKYSLPNLILTQRRHIDTFTIDDIAVINYDHYGRITAPISV